MAATSPLSGMTARRTGEPAVPRPVSRLRRAARSAAAALLAGVLAFGGAPAARADTPSPSPSPSETADPGTVSFVVSPVSDGVVAPGGPLAVSFTVVNSTAFTAPAGRFVLEVGTTPLTTRPALDAWLTGDTARVTTRPVTSTEADPVEPGATVTSGGVVASDDRILTDRAPGVYPLLARYERPGGELVSTSVMIVPRTGGTVTPVAVVVPITAGPLTAGLLTADELSVLTAPGGSLDEQLEAVTNTPAILAIDPAIPASIRVLGDAAPAAATEWLDRLMLLPNARFALQFGDADVASQLASGLSAPLQPTSLQSYMDAADFPVATPTPEPTPGETAPPTEPEYPDLASLLDVGGGRPAVYWPVGGSADADTVAKLGKLGADDVASLTLVPSATTSAGAKTMPAAAKAGDAGLLVYDTGVSAALRQAADTEDNSLRGNPLAAATARLALASLAAGDAPLLVTVDRGADRSRISLAAAIGVATQLPTTRAASLGELTVATPQETKIADAAPEPARVTAAASLRADEDEVSSFATILDDPTVLTGPQRATILQVLGAGWVPLPAAWEEALAANREATRRTLDSVGIVPPTPINFLTSSAPLPFWVRNDLPYPVNVVLYAIPDDLRLDVTRANPVVAGASSNTSVEVPVQSRVGNGEVTIQLQLRSRTSVAIGSPQFVDVTVRADWEGIGVTVILVLVGGLVALGLVRTILRRRQARAADAAPVDRPASGDGPASGSGS